MTTESTTTNDFIDIPSASWNVLYTCRRLTLDEVKRYAESATGELLDVGCGRQPYRSLFQNLTRYQGVDTASSVHDLPPDTVVFDGETLPFEDNSFDCAIATEVFEHVKRPAALFAEIRRVLRPGGQLMLTVPFIQALHESPYDFRRPTPFWLQETLQAAGFDGIEIAALGSWHHSFAHFFGLYAWHCYKNNKFAYPLLALASIHRRLVWNRSRKSRFKPVDGQMCVGWSATAKRS
ncbi:MAG: class I SAM-dependent methyltransferase [Verrucomicrobiota bacterium]